MNGLDTGIIMAYFAGMIVLGIYANRKQTCVDDYYLGGRKMKALSVGALWMAGWVGGSSVSGTATNAYNMGITAIWYVTFIAIGTIIFGFTMAEPIKRISNKLQNITFPELIEARYDSKNRVMATITTIFAMIGFTAAQFVAGAAILNVLTGWSLGVCFLLSAVVIVLYTSTGGLLAVTFTDLAQMLLLLVGVVIIGVPLAHSALSATGQTLSSSLPPSYFSLGTWGWGKILALGVSTVLSFFTGMDSFTRCIAAKDAKTAKHGTLIAACGVMLISLAGTYLGMLAKVILPKVSSTSNCLAEMIVKIYPHGIKGLILVGVLSAIMSTADISVLTASANITRDIYQRYLNPSASEHKMMVLSFVSSAAVGVAAAIFAWFMQDIISILFITFTINSAGLFLPTVCGFFWKRSCAKASFVSMLSAVVIAGGWFIAGSVTSLPIFQIDALWPSFGVSSLLYLIICLTHKQSEKELAQAKIFYAA